MNLTQSNVFHVQCMETSEKIVEILRFLNVQIIERRLWFFSELL